MNARRAYRFRLEPTREQEEGLRRIAGACRAVYNWGLDRRKDHYAEHGKTLPCAAQNLELTALKNQPGLEWLKEADSQALQEALRDLDRAFVNFFEGRARCPKFKRAKAERFAFRIPQFARKADRRVRRAQRVVSRRKQGSKRRKKAKRRLSRVHQKVRNQRTDFVHKVTTGLVGRFDLICIEDLSIKAMARTKLGRSVRDAALGETRRQLEYKALWNYRTLVTVERFFPSSKRCHCCQAINDELSLADRVWGCGCGALHRRDLNAALNLEAEGLRLVAAGQAETLNARGVARKTWEARPCGIEARILRL